MGTGGGGSTVQTQNGEELAQPETLLELLTRGEIHPGPPWAYCNHIQVQSNSPNRAGNFKKGKKATCIDMSQRFHQKQETSRDTMQAQCKQERLRLVSPQHAVYIGIS